MIAPRQDADDLVGVAVERANRDVKRAFVICEPNLHPVARWCAFYRLQLEEVGQRRRGLPRGLVQAAIDTKGPVRHAHGFSALPAILGGLRARRVRRTQKDNQQAGPIGRNAR